MPVTGTLSNFGDEEGWRKLYQKEVIKILETGGTDIAGIPIPITLPLPELAAQQSEATQASIAEGNNLKTMEDGFFKVIESIDTTLPPGPTSGFQDPTFALPIPPIINLLLDIGIPDPVAWVVENIEPFLKIPKEAIEGLSKCENQAFAEELNKIDPTIDVEATIEKLSTVCGFEFSLPTIELPPAINFPDLNFDFALDLSVDWPSFDPFLQIDFNLPTLNWFPIQIMLGIVQALIDLIKRIAALILELIRGLLAFLKVLVEFVLAIILEVIAFFLEIFGQAILFVAEAIAFIKLSIAAFLTAFVGFLINKGLISFASGGLLGIGS
jgi:hypothetical protein